MRKILKRIFWVMAGLLIVAGLTHPWWLAGVIAFYLKGQGMTYDNYTVEGYAHMSWEGVKMETNKGVFECERLRTALPLFWLLRAGSDAYHLEGENWNFTFEDEDTEPVEPWEVFQEVDEVAGMLRSWRLALLLRDGVVHAGSYELSFEKIEWAANRLSWNTDWVLDDKAVESEAEFADGRVDFNIRYGGELLTCEGTAGIEDQRFKVTGKGVWAANDFSFQAEFKEGESLPGLAVIEMRNFSFEGGDFGQPDLTDIAGDFRATWKDNEWKLNLKGEGFWSQDDDKKIPWHVEAAAQGDLDELRVETLDATLPWLKLGISDSLHFSFAEMRYTQPAKLWMDVDLAALPVPELEGHVKLEVSPAREKFGESFTEVRFEGSGETLRMTGYDIRSTKFEGKLNWPRLELDRFEAKLPNDSRIKVNLAGDILERIVESGEFETSLTYDDALVFKPDIPVFENLKAEGEFKGPLLALEHSGEADIGGLTIEGLAPVHASFNWEGKALDENFVEGDIESGAYMLEVAGNIFRNGNNWRALIDNLQLAFKKETVIEAQPGADIHFVQSGDAPLQVEWQKVSLTSPGTELKVISAGEWTGAGARNLEIEVEALDVAFFTPLFSNELPQVYVNRLKASTLEVEGEDGGWPLEIDLDAKYAPNPNLTVETVLKAQNRLGEMLLNALEIKANGKTVIQGGGRLPVSLGWKEGLPYWQTDWKKPFNLEASAGPNPEFWEHLASIFGLLVRRPDLTVSLDGSLAAPRGQVSLKARLVEIGPPHLEEPLEVRELDLSSQFLPDGIAVERLSLLAWDHPFELKARLPMKPELWQRLFRDRELPDWQTATGELSFENLPLERVAAYFPEVFGRGGEVSAQVSYSKEKWFEGNLKLEGASSRPLPTGASMREITADIDLSDRVFQVNTLEGKLGSQPVTMTGKVDAHNLGNPDFDLKIKGERLALVRKEDLLLRAGLDIAVKRTSGGATTVEGKVQLSDGLFLRDLKGFTRKEASSPLARPPYFSIEQKPFADWHLNLQVKGDKFLKINTPLLKGTGSLDLELTGTLREPRAVGEARLADSTVTFPFGRVMLDDGVVRLTTNDPYTPQLLINGSSRSFGYDVSMTVAGTAYDPQIELTSNPPLDANAILLMLTTGAVPVENYRQSSSKRTASVAMYLGRGLLSDTLGFEGSDKLTIRTGENISEEGRETYSVEYQLRDNLSIIGEYDEFDDYNLNVKLKLLSR